MPAERPHRPHGAPVASPLTGNGRIAFTSDRAGNEDIYVMNADGSVVTNLTTNPAEDTGPAWSPDGTQIAFASDRSGPFDIYVMNADGTGLTQLTRTGAGVVASTPAWSPDGKIAFTRTAGGGNAEVWVMNSNGSDPHSLVSEPDGDVHPTWSPDGAEIAFFGFGARINVIRTDGTGLVHLTDGPQDIQPAWSPDGSRIAFTRVGRPEGGVVPTDIYVMAPTGGGWRS
jgi:Tol biopolymer transport system component